MAGCRLCLDGLFNTQGCQGAPAFGSGPHFLYGDPSLVQGIEGLQPDSEKHSTFLNIEPLSGVAFQAHKRIQVRNKNKIIQIIRKTNIDFRSISACFPARTLMFSTRSEMFSSPSSGLTRELKQTKPGRGNTKIWWRSPSCQWISSPTQQYPQEVSSLLSVSLHFL